MDREQILITIIGILLVVLVGTLVFFNKKTNECDEKETNTTTNIDKNEGVVFSISPEEVINKIENKESIVLLDVRTQEEYQSFHIADATLFPLQSLSEQALADFDLGDKEAEIIIYSQREDKSIKAYNLLSEWGYTNIKSLVGGITAFKEAVLNVSTSSELITY